jgi:hypothetical protein
VISGRSFAALPGDRGQCCAASGRGLGRRGTGYDRPAGLAFDTTLVGKTAEMQARASLDHAGVVAARGLEDREVAQRRGC